MTPLLIALQLCCAEPPPLACPEGASETVQRFSEGGAARVFRFCAIAKTKQKHGPAESWSDGKRLAVQSYDRGLKHGIQRTFDPKTGGLRSYQTWQHGQRIGFQVSFDGHGHLEDYGQAGLPEASGQYRQWRYRSGRLEYVTTFLGAAQHGRTWRFHPNGRLALQVDRLFGEAAGRAFEWADDGRFVGGWCYDGQENTLWRTERYEEALTKPCPSDASLRDLSPPASVHAVPAPSAATQDLVPPGIDIPGLVPPVAPRE